MSNATQVERVLLDLGRGKSARFAPLLRLIVVAGAIHGVGMGSFPCASWARAWLMLYAGLKVPILLLGTAALCLPGFVLISAALGLSRAVPRALGAIALLLNSAAFWCAAARGQFAIRRHCAALVAEDAKHRLMRWAWVGSYVFVGIQMGWVLRPFVGDTGKAVTFLRPEPFSNAYVVVIQLVFGG